MHKQFLFYDVDKGLVINETSNLKIFRILFQNFTNFMSSSIILFTMKQITSILTITIATTLTQCNYMRNWILCNIIAERQYTCFFFAKQS
ncbi:ORF-42 [Agrotis segetum nucleopolyhedrovirus A]|uniref:ORF-42 n=1 Tax=Agrotis segetum nuclear polyhedrosis virus TaxID=1962501 RepID=Q287N0_NPVAS|nr:ORF-42 [Agrotis segetum nucleopolyhedrovirus A]AAZ38208.1 ORF-42 [Agrotis segetum nucleopolyhedrovirus A]